MISRLNFEIVKPFLEYQIKDRGLNISLSRENWDTFTGWKKRGKRILRGSKGFQVELVIPFRLSKTRDAEKLGFTRSKKILFSENQTL